MKKFLVVFAALLLMMGLAVQANAYFGATDVIRVVYDITSSTSTNNTAYAWEQATDLGSVSSIIANPSLLGSGTGGTIVIGGTTYTDQYNVSTGAGSVNSAYAFNSANGSNSQLVVAYFAASSSAFWGSGLQNGTQASIGSSTIVSNTISVLGEYLNANTNGGGYNDGNGNVWLSTSNGDSYFKLLDMGPSKSNQGGFTKFYASGAYNGDASLIQGTPTFQGLYAFSSPKTAQTVPSVLTFETTIDSSGNILTTAELPQTATPVPPSVLLFGAGLFGLMGIGRKGLFNS